MEKELNIESVFRVSDDVVVREIEGEIIIVPLISGIGDMDDELYTLNETGKAILKLMDGNKSLAQIAIELCKNFNSPLDEIEKDVLGFTNELVIRSMLVRIN